MSVKSVLRIGVLFLLSAWVLVSTAHSAPKDDEIQYTCVYNIPYYEKEFTYDPERDVPNILVLRVPDKEDGFLEFEPNPGCEWTELSAEEIIARLKERITLKDQMKKANNLYKKEGLILYKKRFDSNKFSADYSVAMTSMLSTYEDPMKQLLEIYKFCGQLSKSANKWHIYEQNENDQCTENQFITGYSSLLEKPAYIYCFAKKINLQNERCSMYVYFKRHRVNIDVQGSQFLEHWPEIWQEVMDDLERLSVMHVWDNRCEGAFCREFVNVLEGHE
jgi:hypothetical protein